MNGSDAKSASLCDARERAPRQARKHGISKHRTWLKLHLGFDEETGEILAAVVTPNSTGDSEVLGEMLDDIDDDIEQVSADGAYDRGYCYD